MAGYSSAIAKIWRSQCTTSIFAKSHKTDKNLESSHYTETDRVEYFLPWWVRKTANRHWAKIRWPEELKRSNVCIVQTPAVTGGLASVT